MKTPMLFKFQEELAEKLADSLHTSNHLMPNINPGYGKACIICRAAQLIYPVRLTVFIRPTVEEFWKLTRKRFDRCNLDIVVVKTKKTISSL